MPTPILSKSNLDHHGFYTVGDLKTYSKLEAIEYSVRLRIPLTWNYNQSVFDQLDWTRDPPGSLDWYYQQRAAQLREHYDYLVLFYSGGSDSHNMLMSFVNNNIFVDEIVQYHQLEAYNGDRSHVSNLEQFATSIPITQALIANNAVYQHTTHRIIDLSPYKNTLFCDKKILDQWWYMYNDFQTPHSAALVEIKKLYPAYQKIIDSGKKMCFVWGIEKPYLRVDSQHRMHCGFQDKALWQVSPDRKHASESWDHDELFYWTPDMPELVLKQAHVVKNFVDQFTDQHADGHHVVRGVLNHDQYGQYQDRINLPHLVFYKHDQSYTLMRNGLRRLLYPHWDPTHVVRPLPRSSLFSETDAAYISNNTPFEHSRRQWLKSVVHFRQWIKQHANEHWYEFPYDPKVAPFRAGFKDCANLYCLEKKSA